MFDGSINGGGLRWASKGDQLIKFDDGFRVGDFEVYPTRLALVRDGTTVRTEPKVMAVLVHLAQRAGQVVTRDEFADEVWRGRVVSDEVLSRDISILRAQLGDNAKDPNYVLTIPRVGYRLIANVRPLHEPEPGAAVPLIAVPESPSDALPLAPSRSTQVGVLHGRRWLLVLMGVLVAGCWS